MSPTIATQFVEILVGHVGLQDHYTRVSGWSV